MKHLIALLCLCSLAAVQAQTNPPAAGTNVPPAADFKAKPPRLYDAANPEPDGKVTCTLYMVGDSTMAQKPVIPAYPERGWGQLLPQYFQADTRIENHAMNGRSSKSFIDEGRWAAVKDKLKAGDWVIIQFGHNDQKKEDPNRFTTPFGMFRTNLMTYVNETRAKGANPILCTAVARRKFDADGHVVDLHGDYITATRQVAEELKVPLLDLNKRTDEMLRQLGVNDSLAIYDHFTTNTFAGLKKDLTDDTHFNAYGASRICDFAVDELKTAAPELARHLNSAK